MDKVIIGDTFYLVNSKVVLLVEDLNKKILDLNKKNDRLRERTKRAYIDGIIWGASQYGGLTIRREDLR